MPLATHSDAFGEFARNAGMHEPDRAWLLTDWDVWVQNPHYRGPTVKHPEDGQDDDAPWLQGAAFWAGCDCHNPLPF